ncbi:MAG TPA: AMP-binding protein, partial [Gemmatimonadales bacterium]|nr:AMP-binding protein [Gemmatimonadales bacterium]
DDDRDAIVFWNELGRQSRLSFAQLRVQVARAAAALAAAGVKQGDRVAGYLPNLPETIIAMLGAAALGALWSSCSPDFGVKGVVDRFGQISPRVLVTVDGYRYAGKKIDLR